MIEVTIQTKDGIKVAYRGSVEAAGTTLFNAVKPYISKDKEILDYWYTALNDSSLGYGLYDLYISGQLVKYTIEDYWLILLTNDQRYNIM